MLTTILDHNDIRLQPIKRVTRKAKTSGQKDTYILGLNEVDDLIAAMFGPITGRWRRRWYRRMCGRRSSASCSAQLDKWPYRSRRSLPPTFGPVPNGIC
jgi:hypothetical protein